MMKPNHYLAIDLGAESGRAILGSLDSGRLHLEEVHRFSNLPIRLQDGLHWDVLQLWSNIKAGLTKAAGIYPGQVSGIAVDTWGVDFALLGQDGSLLGNPYHYRDARTDGMLEEAFRRVPRETIFKCTGIQFMQINTLYQLLSMVISNSPLLQVASAFVTTPDLFNYWLSGRVSGELTIATTTQCFNPVQKSWANELLETMGIPTHIFPEIVLPGTVLGSILPAVAEETGIGIIPVITPACHDTGCAVAAVPAENEHFAWISSGTWSIMGVEAPQPVITPESLEFNFTNEGGVAGTWRFSKNIMGLWLVQECRRTWAHQGEDLSYTELTRLAGEARPFLAVIDADDPDFLYPGDMPARIRAYCARTGQAVPETKGEVVRIALESIALKYRWVIEHLEKILGYRLDPVHIIGGGSQNQLLNRFAANATQRQVVVGPVEATASGNILMQAVALGHLTSVAEARECIRQSVEPQIIDPESPAGWDEAYSVLVKEIEKS
jgi:rhamnulokinase